MFKKLVTMTALVAAIAAGASFSTLAKAEDIKVGIAGPMTGSLSAFGEQLRRGAEAAVRDINAKGGINGNMLVLEVGDDAGDAALGPTVANDLIKRGVKVVVGHFQSGVSIPASAVYAEEGIPMMTPASTNIKLTDDAAAKGWKTVFRSCGRDDLQGAFAGPWIAKTYKGKKVAILDDNTPYGAGLAAETKKAMETAGLKSALNEHYEKGGKDFTALINKLKKDKIDVVYVGGYHDDQGLMLKQAHEAGYKPAAWISGDALNSADFATIGGKENVEGVRFSDASSALSLPAAKEVVEQFRKDGYEPEGYTLPSYAAVQAFAAAIAGSGSTDGTKVSDWLHGNSADTVIGKLQWDAKGDLTKAEYAWFIWHDGKFAQEPLN